MDLQRQEYPSMLLSLQPTQAVQVLNDRIKNAKKLNAIIADWLLERRKVEEQYALALRKLAARPLADESIDLGVFSTPWKKMVNSVQGLAESHRNLALNIEVDVERPLRDFASSNREMKAVPTMSGNLLSLAKDLEEANKAAKKQREKGGKASADKVASAASAVENAQAQWDSQAPYVFEQLQAADEHRLNHLRDVLTQYQTHIIESSSATNSSEEETLNALLNVQTSDEVSTFVMKTTANQPTRDLSVISPSSSRPAPPVHTVSGGLVPTTSASQGDDGSSHRSSQAQDRLPERPKTGSSSIGKGFTLKRLGTVINRRKSMHPYDQTISPERKKSSSNLGPFRRRTKEKLDTSDLQPVQSNEERRFSEVTRPESAPGPSAQEPLSPVKENGTAAEEPPPSQAGLGLMNGTEPSGDSKLPEPLLPSPPPVNRSSMVEFPTSKPATDGQGFSVPPPATDPITLAEQEAALAGEGAVSQPNFKVDIRNAPIAEEDGDASAAMANVANTLRMSAAPRRSQGTVRGRRDGNRNTIMLPNDQAPIISAPEPATSPPNSAPLPAASSPSETPPVQTATSPSMAQSPFKLAHRSTLMAEDHASSDTHSVRSGRSLSSSASSTVKHPEMHEPGLNSSIVETISAWFNQGVATRAVLIGEVALAYNPQDFSAPFGTDTIRLNNFSELEKVAPNPTFIEAVNDNPGTYTVNLSQATKTAVAFKYQVRLDESSIASYAPLLLKPAWKIEPTQASVIATYGLNPAFTDSIVLSQSSITLSNVIIIVHLDPTGPRATSCRAMGGGTFSREKNLVYWRLGDVTLSKDGPTQTLKARFFTDGEAKTGNVEARWELHDENAAGAGSQLSVSLMEHSTGTEGESDPFADEGTSSAVVVSWKDVRTVKGLRSGTYLAT